MTERCAFIGLGHMGGPMAANLVKAGHSVHGYDIVPAARDRLDAVGGQSAASVSECVQDATFVVTMLPSSPHVEQTLSGPDGVFANAAPDATLIEMSTIAPSVTRRLASEASARSLAMIDAPVSRGQPAAVRGELLIMVGGPEASCVRALPILRAMGSDVVHVGPSGSGAVAKLVNNMIVGSILASTAEALAWGVDAGVPLEPLLEVLKRASGHSWLLENMFPRAFGGDFAPGFLVDHMHKDLSLAVGEAGEGAMPVWMASAARELFSAAKAAEMGKLDCTAVLQLMERLTGTPVRFAAATDGQVQEQLPGHDMEEVP